MAKIDLLSSEVRAEIDKWIAKYPAEKKRSAVVGALTAVQDAHGGSLTPALMEAVAEYLDLPPIAVLEVASFYTLYDLKPVGQHKIYLCTNVSCMLCGSDQIAEHLKERLGIGFGETTADGKFTLKEVECLAACAGAPMMQVDKTYHENLTRERVDDILAEFD